MAFRWRRVMTSFKNDIQHFFPYLFEKWGFEFVDITNDHGENVVVVQSSTMRIRFVHDRADFFLDFGRIGEPDRWIEFHKIMDQLIAEGHVHAGYKYSNKIKHVSRLLELHFPEILTSLLK